MFSICLVLPNWLFKTEDAVFTLCILLCFLPANLLLATQTTYTFYPLGDTSLNGSEHLNDNEGLGAHLRIHDNFSHVLLGFSHQDLISRLSTNQVISVSLKLYVEKNLKNWGSGAYVEAHRINKDWTETSVTWEGSFYDDYVSASVLHQNSDTGWMSYDVTSDVQILLNGYEYFGWLLRKRNSTDSGSVDYTSIQGATLYKPKLEITIDDQAACSPTIIESIFPAVIPADGTNRTITVKGQSLENITSVTIDGIVVTFTQVDSTTITFMVNNSSIGTHEVSFRSNCLTQPLNIYEIEAKSITNGLEASAACNAAGLVTYFSRRKNKLCWRQFPTRLIGYTGDFTQITWDFKWNIDSDDEDNLNDDSTIIRDYFAAAQYAPGSGNSSRGSNFIRVFAMGGGCNNSAGPEDCKGYPEERAEPGDPDPPPAESETMPFNAIGGDYDIEGLSSDGMMLNTTWKKRLKNFIKYADQNGIAMMVDLFDENTMTGSSWSNHPWNPSNNNMSCTELPSGGITAFPYFYKICSDFTDATACNNTLNCLGLRERAYVHSVMSTIRDTKKCGDGDDRCRNVLVEVMNEAVFDENWPNNPQNDPEYFTEDQFKIWHDTVALWVESRGAYMIAANVKEAPGSPDPCPPSTFSDFCRLQACTHTGCPNYFEAFFARRLDIVSLHWQTWEGDICGRYSDALRLRKPVIFDDDGGCGSCPNHPRNINNKVELWAQNVSEAERCDTPAQKKGKLHFYHAGDGSKLEGISPHYVPTACIWDDFKEVDCQVWNAVADGFPDKYCGTDVTPCENKIYYCEHDVTGCPQDNIP